MIQITRLAFININDIQLKALQENVLAHWQQVKDEDIRITMDYGGTLMVHMPNIVIGIEEDGYTHS